MPFFIRKPAKRKLQPKKKSKPPKNIVAPSETNSRKDQEIESESEDEFVEKKHESFSEDEDAHLTTQEKKIKLAKKYLEVVEEEEKSKLEANEDLNDNVLKRLKDEELEKEGKLKKKIADYIEFDLNNRHILTCKQHKLSITCTKLSWDQRYLYSASKDCTIVKWCLDDFSKVKFLAFKIKKRNSNASDLSSKRHSGVINCLAVSSDDKYLISGDEKGILNVWRTEDLEFVRTLDGHKKAITDLAVCSSTNSLYSTSQDALVKLWNLNEFGYMETLFGHQAPVASIDVINSNKVVTAGGTDKTVRVWKIQEESQSIYNGHAGSIDIVRKLDEGFFISGGDDGCLCLWGALKKKPLFVQSAAHGLCSTNNQPNWISALAVFPNGDLIASGSCNGCIALWKWTRGSKMFELLRTIPVEGYVNSLHFTSNTKYLVVGIGREHRLGRWRSIDGIRNSIICIPISYEVRQ